MASKSKQRSKTNGHADAAPITVHPSTNIPFNRLQLSPDNVRNIYDKARISLLAESIARVGLLQSLSVQPVLEDGNDAGRFSVIGGGRRFRALEQLVAAGRLASDHPIPCVPADGIAADISLVENAEREALLGSVSQLSCWVRTAVMVMGESYGAYQGRQTDVRDKRSRSEARTTLEAAATPQAF